METNGKSLKANQAFTTEKSWIDARLAYRRLVYKMLRDIEIHCEDVICLAQNYLQLTLNQFQAICESEEIERIAEGGADGVDEKQRQVMENLADPDDERTRLNSHDVNAFEQELNSITPIQKIEEEEETKEGLSSFDNSGLSLDSQQTLSKKECLQILQLIISVKREQTFCATEDAQIFISKPIRSSNKRSKEHGLSSSAQKQSTPKTQQLEEQSITSELGTEEQVMMMNIDYFELWDRVFQKFAVEEKRVQNSFKAQSIKML